jgi:hypothetical protein
MFVITEGDAAAIRAIFSQEGELSAAIELRRRFPGGIDNAKARACAKTIAGWTPPPAQLTFMLATGLLRRDPGFATEPFTITKLAVLFKPRAQVRCGARPRPAPASP